MTTRLAFKSKCENLYGGWMRPAPRQRIHDPRLGEVQARVATTSAPLRGLRVMLDAGHGGDDTGALGPSGLAESDLNLVQAAWLESILKTKARRCARFAATTRLRLDDRCHKGGRLGAGSLRQPASNSVGMARIRYPL